MKDLLRFDTVVAACALVMSTITAGALVYQTRVIPQPVHACSEHQAIFAPFTVVAPAA